MITYTSLGSFTCGNVDIWSRFNIQWRKCSAMAEGGDSSPKDRLRSEMIGNLATTDAHFKHQVRGEPDLSVEEKSNIAVSLLNKSPALFLERFSKYLSLKDTEYFKDQTGDYQVEFYVGEIEKRFADTSHNAVKNRRYKALQELMDGGEYFSEEEMKWRDPLLFQQMVGQYELDSERTEREEQDIDKSDLKFSTILLKHMDTQANKQYYDVLKEREEEQEEEEEESDEEEEEEMENDTDTKHVKPGANTEGEDEESKVSEVERNILRTEFLRIMQERFLSGEEADFDYSTIDHNTEYDPLDIIGNDAQEKYFAREDELSDTDSLNGAYQRSCETRLRNRMEGTETRIEVKEDKEEVEEEINKQMKKVEVDDYMDYVPTDDLVQ